MNPNPHSQECSYFVLGLQCMVATSSGHEVVFLIKLKVIYHTNILKALKETVPEYKRFSAVITGTKTTPNDWEMSQIHEEVEV